MDHLVQDWIYLDLYGVYPFNLLYIFIFNNMCVFANFLLPHQTENRYESIYMNTFPFGVCVWVLDELFCVCTQSNYCLIYAIYSFFLLLLLLRLLLLLLLRCKIYHNLEKEKKLFTKLLPSLVGQRSAGSVNVASISCYRHKNVFTTKKSDKTNAVNT